MPNGKEYVPGVSFAPDLNEMCSQEDLLSFIPYLSEESYLTFQNLEFPPYFPMPLRFSGWSRGDSLLIRDESLFGNLSFHFYQLLNSNYYRLVISLNPTSVYRWTGRLVVEGKLEKIVTRALAFFAIMSSCSETAWESLDFWQKTGNSFAELERSDALCLHKMWFLVLDNNVSTISKIPPAETREVYEENSIHVLGLLSTLKTHLNRNLKQGL
jgi:hypothetical protein